MESKQYTYKELLEIIRILRSENGCPWDRVQTHESLKSCLIEECYEVIEAINNKDDENLKEELGDVMLQVVLHSRIAEEEQCFAMENVIQGLCEKLVRRHPYVFGNAKAETEEEGLQNWEAIKKAEKVSRGQQNEGELGKVPKAFPALIRAQKVQKKAERNYQYQTDIQAAKAQINSLMASLIKAQESGNGLEIKEKSGLFLFEVVNILRILGVNAENSLTNETETFINKFEGNG